MTEVIIHRIHTILDNTTMSSSHTCERAFFTLGKKNVTKWPHLCLTIIAEKRMVSLLHTIWSVLLGPTWPSYLLVHLLFPALLFMLDYYSSCSNHDDNRETSKATPSQGRLGGIPNATTHESIPAMLEVQLQTSGQSRRRLVFQVNHSCAWQCTHTLSFNTRRWCNRWL